MEIDTTRSKLLDALTQADDSSRHERAGRIEWLAQYTEHVGVVMGEMAAMQMMKEAKSSFISGQFVGALLLATSFVEQTLSEELERVTSASERNKTLETMIKLARECLNFPEELLDRTDRLRQLRNPFTHRKPDDHPYSFRARFLVAKEHPATVLERDAKLAMEVMLEWFQRTLRYA